MQKKEEDIATLSSQNLVINSIWNVVMVSTKAYWFSALDSLPEKVYNFCIRYMNNTLATNKNLLLWKKKHTSKCFACGNEQTLGHVVGGCNIHLREGRVNWRHDSILVNLANSLKAYSDVQLYVDNDNFRSSSIITVDDQRPDLLLIDERNNMYVLELTVGFEPNIENNGNWKNVKYKELLKSMEKDYTSVTSINLSMGSLGIIGKDSINLHKLLKATIMNKNSIAYCIKKAFCMLHLVYVLPILYKG